MIHRIVQAALRQRFLVLMLTAFITVGGVLSFQRMPVDAYPDLSPPQVEIITQWPDHASEEVERLVTLPLELQMLFPETPQLFVMAAMLADKFFLSMLHKASKPAVPAACFFFSSASDGLTYRGWRLPTASS